MGIQMAECNRDVPNWNTSGLHPLGYAVLIEPYEPDVQGAASSIIIPKDIRNKMSAVDQRARVIEIGPLAWSGEPVARAAPGDIVLVTKYAGYVASEGQTKDGKTYRIVNDVDIFCRMEGV